MAALTEMRAEQPLTQESLLSEMTAVMRELDAWWANGDFKGSHQHGGGVKKIFTF